MTEQRKYPFCAIVGQDDMKLALILNIISPGIGGVLIRGEKGTAKSTAVRALTEVMPLRNQAEGCRFSCDPYDPSCLCSECKAKATLSAVKGKMRVVDLPVSATEDRVVGTIDIEHALKFGEKRFEAGILAEANRNILYVDEVNLLDDHVVDLLLDSAAMGVNTVEREGISYSHPARFVLVGTMNPEEGDLRPQLLDRFGLVVDVVGETDIDRRMEIVRRRLAFEENPDLFASTYEKEQSELGQRIMSARNNLHTIRYSENCLRAIAETVIAMDVDGHRADITLLKTAIASAAFRGANYVEAQDLLLGAKLALPHRMRRRPFDEGIIDFNTICEMLGKYEI